MKTKPILLLTLLLSFFNGFCNDIEKPAANNSDKDRLQISFYEMIDEIVNCKDLTYTLENVEIVYSEYDYLEYLNLQSYSKIDRLILEPNIHFINCIFTPDNKTIFLNISSERNLIFENCKFKKTTLKESLKFFGCHLKNLVFYNSDIEGLLITKCRISEGLLIKGCNFYNNSLKITSTQLIERRVVIGGWPFLFTSSGNSNIYDLRINNCKFISEKNLSNRVHIGGDYKEIDIDDTKFNVPVDFEDCYIHNSFHGHDCYFKYPVGVERFYFPEKATNFNWNMLKGYKLCLYDNKKPYMAKSGSELVNLFNYTELISAYKNFYSMYKTRGDMESANGCYVEMKDIETRRLKFLHKQNPTVKSLFTLKLNQFLKFFCEYGTSPVRSLIISLYVILSFAIFYFFFYSEWDKINRSLLMKRAGKLIQYFSSEQKLEDFYTEQHKDEFQSYEDFKNTITQNRKVVLFL